MQTATVSRLTIAALAFAAASAVAADNAHKGCVELKSVAETEVEYVDDQGRQATKLVPAGRVIPGTQVVWTVTATNICDKPAAKVSIDNPIPAQMSYVPDSAIGAGADILFSTDGQRFAEPAALQIVWSVPALEIVGPAVNVIATSSLLAVQGAFVIVHLNV